MTLYPSITPLLPFTISILFIFPYSIDFQIQEHQIISTLKKYISIEQKDRIHTVRRMRHVQSIDKPASVSYKSTLVCYLHQFILLINSFTIIS